MSNTSSNFNALVNTIESSYEFCLAYAAQGKDNENQKGSSSEIRTEISALSGALTNVGRAAADHIKATQASSEAFNAATDLLIQDALKASVMVQLVLASAVAISCCRRQTINPKTGNCAFRLDLELPGWHR